MKTIFGVLFCFMLGYASSGAQEYKGMGGGGFTIGYGNLDVSKLQVFAPAGTPAFKNDQLLIGGTGHAFIQDFVIGGSGFGIIGDKIRTDTLELALSGGLGTFDFGYLILNEKRIKIYPMLGIGGYGYGIGITSNRNLSVNDVVKNPGREINISKGGIVLDVSLSINVIPFLTHDKKDNSYGGFMTGVKLGYIYGFHSSDWSFSGGDISGGPDFGLNMPYVKLVIGGFGYQKKEEDQAHFSE